MTIELKKVDLFKRSVDAISVFIKEGNFRFSSNGFYFKATDQSQIVLVDFVLEKKFFDKYVIEPNMVGLDLEELSKIMNRALPNDKLVIDLNDSELILTLQSDLIRTFHLPLLEISDQDVKLPKSKYDAKLEFNAKLFKETLKDASLFGSGIIFRIESGKLFIEARGFQGALKTVVKSSKQVSVNSKKEIVSKYSLNYLMNIVREADQDKKILIELSSDAPMKVSYKIGEAKIHYYLAHMIL